MHLGHHASLRSRRSAARHARKLLGIARGSLEVLVMPYTFGAPGADCVPAWCEKPLARNADYLATAPKIGKGKGPGSRKLALPIDCSSSPADVAVIYNGSLYTAEKRARRSSDPAGQAGDTTA
jgi:hypothetical protein